MKKTLEIECPDGYKPVYNAETGKVEIVPESITAIIKTYEDARKYLGYLSVDFVAYNKSTNALAKLQTILEALNKGYKFDLIEGKIWLPRIRFYRIGNIPKKDVKVINTFRYRRERYALINEVFPYLGDARGLGSIASYDSVGYVRPDIGMFGCRSREIAEYVSVQFSKLIFEACFARHFQDGEFEWLD